jgi:hypothetical protein
MGFRRYKNVSPEAGGEVVSFRVRSDRACFVAVYCHQSDGSSVLFFQQLAAEHLRAGWQSH